MCLMWRSRRSSGPLGAAMADVTVITLSPTDLKSMLAEAVATAVERVVGTSGQRMTRGEVARHYRVSERTIMRHPGRYPAAGADGTWSRAEVLRWDRERSGEAKNLPNTAPQSA